jgi:hypothetical protein
MPANIEIVLAPRDLPLIDFRSEDRFSVESRSCENLA